MDVFNMRNKVNTRIMKLAVWLEIWRDSKGQDLIEYALMAGFVAVAAGSAMPIIATRISTIFSKVGSTMAAAASQS